MSIEANKATVRAACQHIHDRNIPALLDQLHDEGSWSVVYRPDRFEFAGFRDKKAFGEMIGGFLSIFTEFSFRITSITAEEDRVVAEAVSEGVGPGGATYKNVYNFIFYMKDGKILTAKEFFDPFEVLAFVEQLPKQA